MNRSVTITRALLLIAPPLALFSSKAGNDIQSGRLLLTWGDIVSAVHLGKERTTQVMIEVSIRVVINQVVGLLLVASSSMAFSHMTWFFLAAARWPGRKVEGRQRDSPEICAHLRDDAL